MKLQTTKIFPPDKQVLIKVKSELRDLGVQLSSSLSFKVHIEHTITAASRLDGWGLRSFSGRSRRVLLTVWKNLIQPKLDYCSQLWSPADQISINKIESVQRQIVERIKDNQLSGLNYWEKLRELGLYSQERRRERYQVIFIWKISQGMVSGYNIDFTPTLMQGGADMLFLRGWSGQHQPK